MVKLLLSATMMMSAMPASALEWTVSTADLVADKYEKRTFGDRAKTFSVGEYVCGIGRVEVKDGLSYRNVYCLHNGVMMGSSITCSERGGEFTELKVFSDDLTKTVAKLLLHCGE